jgi:predicted nucleotidyltransferase
MGGGGHHSSSNDYNKTIKDAQDKSLSSSFDSDVNQKIDDKLADFNKRDAEKHRIHLDEIQEIIEDDIEGAIDLRFGGSVSKRTYVDGLSDVDVLVYINKSELIEKSPREVLEFIKTKLHGRLKNVDDISVGSLAVTVKFSDGTEIQLLPAIRKGDGCVIPKQKGNEWSNIIRPQKFAKKLTDVNQKNDGKVVPVIKLVKAINKTQLSEDQQLTGYHIESLAIEIFKNYPEDRPKTSKAMLTYFFETAKERITSPIKDKTGQSYHVDDDLGPENSPERLRASRSLNRIYNKMKTADDIKSSSDWDTILGDVNE